MIGRAIERLPALNKEAKVYNVHYYNCACQKVQNKVNADSAEEAEAIVALASGPGSFAHDACEVHPGNPEGLRP